MKLHQKPSVIVLAAAVFGIGLSSLTAQTAPASSGSAASQEAVKLDPFSVSAASDVGFVAANSLAGGRIATALKDTPVAYSVLTSEFLEAFNINDAGAAAEFSVNTTNYVNDGLNGVSGSTTIQVRIRGQNANTPTRNFFPPIRRTTPITRIELILRAGPTLRSLVPAVLRAPRIPFRSSQ